MAVRIARLGTPRDKNEAHCHRSVLRALLAERGAKFAQGALNAAPPRCCRAARR
jgi:hypothetical protein